MSGIKDYYDYADQVQMAEGIRIVISYFFFFFFIFIRDKNLFTEGYRWSEEIADFVSRSTSAWNNFVESFARFVTKRSEAWPLEGIVPIDVSFEKNCWEFASTPSSAKHYVDGNQVARYFDDLIIRKLYDSPNCIFICTSPTIYLRNSVIFLCAWESILKA